MLKLLLLSALIATSTGFEYIFQPGPEVPATQGQVWPQPQFVDTLDDRFFIFLPSEFHFQSVGQSCVTLVEALARYQNIIVSSNRPVEGTAYVPWTSDNSSLGYLSGLYVDLTGSCNDNEYPSIDMKEEYVLNVTSRVQKLSSETIWGILRGLETFSQLIYLTSDLSQHRIDTNSIRDFPRLAHRGLLLDTSRHYLSREIILRFLDTLAYNKFNVFHWHIVDDNSFPYVSSTFPDLSKKGAFYKTYIYDQKFVATVQEHARKRGIRVLVEFDTPGHTLSWGLGNPDLLTACYNVPMLNWGPIDPTKNSTYTFVFKLFDEIKGVFKDNYVHLGGDEVDYSCWISNPEVNQFMEENGIAGDYAALQGYYTDKLINHVTSLGFKTVVWEDVLDNGVDLPEGTVVNVWQSADPAGALLNVTSRGYPAIISSYWYLDVVASGGDWLKYYNVDPQDFNGTEAEQNLVIGAEACMWTEVVDDNNLESKVWPRASAAAEKFWSAPNGPLLDIASQYPVAARLQEQACRLDKRGISACPPTGPSICL